MKIHLLPPRGERVGAVAVDELANQGQDGVRGTQHPNGAAFGRAMRETLRNPSSGLSKASVRLLVDQVTVGEQQIEIRGSKAALLAAAVSDPESLRKGEVPSSVHEWRGSGTGRQSSPFVRAEQPITNFYER
jgi:hypothetical protein